MGQVLEVATRKANERQREVHEKQREMLLESRRKAAALFRGTAEAAPKEAKSATEVPKQSEGAEGGAKAGGTDPVAPSQPPVDVEAEVQKRLQAALTPAQQQLAEAKAQSDAELALAESNPYEFLKKRGLDLDRWQARLMNGGEASAEEKFQQQITAKIEEVRAENRQLRQQMEQSAFAAKRQKAIDVFTPVAEEHFPLVAAKMGVAPALDEMTRLSREAVMRGEAAINPEQYFKALEERLLTTDKAYLQNAKVLAKLGLSSAKSPIADAAETPRTLSNRTTSSVGSAKPQVQSWSDAKAAGRAMIAQLKAAGRL